MVALVALLLVIALLTSISASQEKILFQPPTSYGIAVDSHRVDYKAADGQRLTGYLIGDPGTAPGSLLCFHGNADLAMWQLEWARSVERRTQYAVMLAEYRGYMSLEGNPTYETSKLDAVAAYEHLNSTYGRDIILSYFGHSLGSAVATELAQLHAPRSLLLQSPFSSASAMARLILTPPIALLWKAVSRIHFDTLSAVAQLDVPVSVVHGRRDKVVPLRMGLAVYSAARIKGVLLALEDAGHSDIEKVAGERYWQWISSALTAANRETSSSQDIKIH
jgi:uncharacterized protein